MKRRSVSVGQQKKAARLAWKTPPPEAVQIAVATHQTQGQRTNDFANATEGELLTFVFQCDRGSVDDACGCRRGPTDVMCVDGVSEPPRAAARRDA